MHLVRGKKIDVRDVHICSGVDPIELKFTRSIVVLVLFVNRGLLLGCNLIKFTIKLHDVFKAYRIFRHKKLNRILNTATHIHRNANGTQTYLPHYT